MKQVEKRSFALVCKTTQRDFKGKFQWLLLAAFGQFSQYRIQGSDGVWVRQIDAAD